MSEWHGRFHRHYERGGDDDCWRWQSFRNADGYGRFRLDDKSQIASRLAYVIAMGAIPKNLCVLHRCDEPSCVNPAHLFLGTHRENMADRNKKGRARGGSLRGAKNPQAKLNASQVDEMRRLIVEGCTSQREIAAKFGITQPQVSGIKNGKSW